MTDAPSSILLLRLQSVGSNTNLWGGYLNTALQTLERASKGYQALAVTGDATISWTNYSAANDGAVAFLKLTGSISGSATLTFPGYQHFVAVWNATGQTVTVKCSGGSGVPVPNGRKTLLFCDGTDYYSAAPTWTNDSTALVNAGDLTTFTQVQTLIANASLPATAGTVLNSATDTTAGYISQKVPSARGIQTSTGNAGGNETLVLALDEGQVALLAGVYG